MPHIEMKLQWQVANNLGWSVKVSLKDLIETKGDNFTEKLQWAKQIGGILTVLT